jgi:hypothetical protein
MCHQGKGISKLSQIHTPFGLQRKASLAGGFSKMTRSKNSSFNSEYSSSLPKASRQHRLSVSFSNYTDAVSADALDSWVSTFTIQPKEADSSVNPRASGDHQNVRNTSSEIPRRSSSSRSNPKSWFPVTDSGFGLSIIEGLTASETCTGASELSAALGINPPANPPSPIVSSTTHSRSMSSHIPDCPVKEQHAVTMGSHQSSTRMAKDVNGMDENEKIEHHPIVDRLAGQGLRRPLQEQDQRQGDVTDHRSADSSIKVGSRYTPMDTFEVARLNEHGHKIATTLQSCRNQDAVVRGRKIRELHRARQDIDAAVKEQTEQFKTPSQTGFLNDEDAFIFPIPPDSVQRGSQSIVSVEYSTGHAPVAGTVHLSPIMMVAEQVPVSRGRQIKKPARLVFRERRGSKPLAIAVRTFDDAVHPPAVEIGATQISASPQESASRISETPLTLEKEESQPTTSAMTSVTQQTLARTPSTAPPGPPPKSTARVEIIHQKRLSTPFLSTTSVGVQPQAVTATTTSMHRTSVCSSHTSTSKGTRLEARLEALERENRLLEAALMAVLKTSGTLNRCPCVLLSERTESVVTPSFGSLENRRSSVLHHGRVGYGPVGAKGEERRGSVESNGSGESAISALEVYLGTRIGN